MGQVYTAELVIRHDKAGKRYLYDIVKIKKVHVIIKLMYDTMLKKDNAR